MIDLTLHKEQIEKNAKLCARKGILLPTFRQMADSKLIPAEIRDELKNIDLNEVPFPQPFPGKLGKRTYRKRWNLRRS